MSGNQHHQHHHQNIVSFSFDRELIGSRYLGTREHRYVKKPSPFFSTSSQLSSTRDLLNSGHFTSRLPRVLVEHEFDLVSSKVNKIFCGQWLDERRCLLGTKCNKLLLLDTFTGMYAVQSPLKSHPSTNNIQDHCGVHAISINPSRTLLATGAEHVNDVAIYSLPDLEPVMVGFKAHSYWIFDILWLDDEHVVSGAGDNRLALWSVGSGSNNGSIYMKNSSENFVHRNKAPMAEFCPYKLASTRQGRKRRASTMPTFIPQSKMSRHKDQKNRYHRRRTLWDEVRHMSSSSSSGASTNSSSANNSSSSNFMQLNCDASPSPNRSQSQSRLSSFFSNFNASSRFATPQISNNDNDNDDDDDEDDSDEYDVTEDEDDDDDDDDEDDDDDDSDVTDDDLDELVYQDDDFNSYGFSYADDASLIWPSSHSRVEVDDYFDEDEVEDTEEEEEITDSTNLRASSSSLSSPSKRTRTVGTMTDGANPYRFRTPTKTITCKHSNRIRALAYNPKRNEIAAISMNSAFHYFDVKRFEQKYSKKLSPLKENVCLTINQDYSIYAIGSASHVQLIDSNNAHPITEPILVKQDIGIRSLHFRDYVLSVGTGVGTILFYDVRAKKFLPSDHDAPLIAPNENTPNKNYLKLNTKRGWIWKNENYYEHLPYSTNEDTTHAIYSHSYDPTGTKLLTVGGPLTINLYGHYAAVWE